MAVTINPGARQTKVGTFDAVENLLYSTSTVRQRISPYLAITTIAASTATADNTRGLFTIPGSTSTEPPEEGMEKIVKMLGTGPGANVVFESLATGFSWGPFSTSSDDQRIAAPTGAFVLSTRGHYVWAKFCEGQWQILSGHATLSTGT